VLKRYVICVHFVHKLYTKYIFGVFYFFIIFFEKKNAKKYCVYNLCTNTISHVVNYFFKNYFVFYFLFLVFLKKLYLFRKVF